MRLKLKIHEVHNRMNSIKGNMNKNHKYKKVNKHIFLIDKHDINSMKWSLLHDKLSQETKEHITPQ